MSVQINDWMAAQAQVSLKRLLPRLEPVLDDSAERDVFVARLQAHFPTIFSLLHSLYGTYYDFFYHLEQIMLTTAQMYVARPRDLKALDEQREADPTWFQGENMMGGVCYVDLFAGNLQGIRDKIPYFEELGLTYLHLMPLFRSPEGDSDGGYAVSSYREVNPALGTMDELADLAAELRQHGISLVIDFVFNHTSDEHDWALRASAGNPEFQSYYFMYDDRTLPDQYERTLREIFPEQAPGNFTFRPEIEKWVWTTFHDYQWDLNYSNPIVFNAMLEEMLFLANHGVEFLRLDAVAFIWKQMGTGCENLPQVHFIIQAYNALLRLAAPAMLFKSEAIVHPAAVATYISPEESPISYHPTLMALSWEALATREVKLLHHSMVRRFAIPSGCAWVNYVRSHDDIGWTFADEDAAEIGVNGFNHRQFLNHFYIGEFPGSFALGLSFNFNPDTLDMRISGTCASLAGLESAGDDALLVDHAIRRILLIYGIALSAGGIPLLYLGDEIGTLNDYSYNDDPAKAEDSRWAHRPYFDWNRAERRHDAATVEGRIFQSLRHLIQVRKKTPALANRQTEFFDSRNPHVLSFVRNGEILVLANFSEREQIVSTSTLGVHWTTTESAIDILSDAIFTISDSIKLAPYQLFWFKNR